MFDSPRGLLAGCSIDELKARTTHAAYRGYWDGITRRWREVAAWERDTGWTLDIGSCAGGQFTWLVREAGLEYHLTGSDDALAYVSRQIDKLAQVFPPGAGPRKMHPYWSEAHVCLAADLCRAGLDAGRHDALCRMVRDCLLEAPFDGWDAPYNYLAGHNKPGTEMMCAGVCALTWGEDAGRSDWRDVVGRAIDAAVAYCRHGLDRAAFGYEGTMYTYPGMDAIYLFAQLLYQRGIANLFESVDELAAYPGAIRQLLFPDRKGLTPLCDGGIYNPKSYAFLLLTAKHYNRPEDLGLWHAYRGPGRAADPVPNNNPQLNWPDAGATGPTRRDGWGHNLYPFLWWDADAPRQEIEQSAAPLAIYSPGTELAFFRTSWSRDAVYLNVSGQGRGHTTYDHVHPDGGHFTLFAHGEYLAIDTGYWNDREQHHSVVLIEGKGQHGRDVNNPLSRHHAGHLTGFERHAMLDYVRADQAGPRNCIGADRHVLFVRTGGDDAYIVLIDNVNPDHQAHTFQWQLQAHPESTVHIAGERKAVIEKPNARAELTFISPKPSDFPRSPCTFGLQTGIVYGGYVSEEEDPTPVDPPEPEVIGDMRFMPHNPGMRYSRKQAREMKSELAFSCWYWPRLVAEQSGPSLLLMTVIAPRRSGAAPLPVHDRSGHRVFRADVEGDTFTDTVIAAVDHSLIKFDDVSGYAELAVVRRDKSGKVIDTWTLGGFPLDVR